MARRCVNRTGHKTIRTGRSDLINMPRWNNKVGTDPLATKLLVCTYNTNNRRACQHYIRYSGLCLGFTSGWWLRHILCSPLLCHYHRHNNKVYGVCGHYSLTSSMQKTTLPTDNINYLYYNSPYGHCLSLSLPHLYLWRRPSSGPIALRNVFKCSTWHTFFAIRFWHFSSTVFIEKNPQNGYLC